jgi:ankyrin repeat protein
MDERFQAVEAALAAGDVERLASLLKADPDLAMARSQCSHPTFLQCLVLSMPPVDGLEMLIDLLASQQAELTEPLIAASGMNNVRAIEKLLDLGARIEGNGQWSPLEEALYWGNQAAVSLLLERGAPVANLRTAAALGDLDRIARCFEDRGDLTAAAGEVAWPFFSALTPIPVDVRRDRQQVLGNALVYAAAWGQTEAVRLLIAADAQVNFIPAGFDFAGTPLHYAALRGRRAMVDQLLGAGADPAIRDTKIGKLPEDWADHDEHEDLAEYLRQVRQQAG